MKLLAIGAALMGAVAAGPAWSAALALQGDVYLVVDADSESISGGVKTSDEGDGYGLKGEVSFANYFVGGLEYEIQKYDRTNTDVDQLRLTAGVQSTGKVRFAFLPQYVRFNIESGGSDDDADGYGLHGRIVWDPTAKLQLYSQMGYVNVSVDDNTLTDDEFDGAEYAVGGAWAFTKMFGAFVDYRTTHLTNNQGPEFNIDEVRAGGRFMFGM